MALSGVIGEEPASPEVKTELCSSDALQQTGKNNSNKNGPGCCSGAALLRDEARTNVPLTPSGKLVEMTVQGGAAYFDFPIFLVPDGVALADSIFCRAFWSVEREQFLSNLFHIINDPSIFVVKKSAC